MNEYQARDKVGQINCIVRNICIMLDQLRQVAFFAKTIDHGSFRGAANELGLSPSVVSHHVSQLEEHLGVALIYRTTRKLALTPEGEKLLATTSPMLNAVEVTLSDLSNSARRAAGELRLTTPSILIQSPLTDMLAAFSTSNPGIKLSLNYSDEREDIITGGYDLAIRMALKHHSSTTTRKLFEVQRRLVASTDYLKGCKKIVKPQDILDCTWIGLTPIRHIKPTFKKPRSKPVAIKPTANIAANDAFAMYHLARAGAGLAIVPECLAEEGIASGDVQYVLPDWNLDPIEVYAEWPQNAPKNGLISLLVDAICPSRSLR